MRVVIARAGQVVLNGCFKCFCLDITELVVFVELFDERVIHLTIINKDYCTLFQSLLINSLPGSHIAYEHKAILLVKVLVIFIAHLNVT